MLSTLATGRIFPFLTFPGNLALEWGEFGIRCNCVAPGPISETPGLEKLSFLGSIWMGLENLRTKKVIILSTGRSRSRSNDPFLILANVTAQLDQTWLGAATVYY